MFTLLGKIALRGEPPAVFFILFMGFNKISFFLSFNFGCLLLLVAIVTACDIESNPAPCVRKSCSSVPIVADFITIWISVRWVNRSVA